MAITGIIESDIILKQGDTFFYSFSATNSENEPVTGIAERFKSQVKDKANGTLYGDLMIDETDTPGTYTLKSGTTDGIQDTQTWKTGSAVFDIQYSDGEVVQSTYSVKFAIVGDVTQ